MSSYQIYRPTHFNQYVSDVSPEDFVNVIQTKQKQYDTNYDRIQSEINNIYNLPILREQDKEYLRGKEKELLSHINKHSNLDVGDNRNASYLMGNVHKIYQDPNILNAVESTSRIQTFMKNVDELKKSHPDKYDANTEAWDMRAYQDYVSGKTNTYNGPTTPTIAQDVDKKAMDAYSKMKQTYMGSEGGKDFSGITSERIAAQLKATLSDADQKQLYINAWANGMLNPSLAPRLIETQNSHIKEYEEARKKYEANNQFDKVKEMDANIKGTQAYIKRIQENPENGLFEDYFTHYVGGIAEANEIQEVKSDAVYLQKQRMDFDAQQAKDKRKFDEDKYKFEQGEQNKRTQALIDGRFNVAQLKKSGLPNDVHVLDAIIEDINNTSAATPESVNPNAFEVRILDTANPANNGKEVMLDLSAKHILIKYPDATTGSMKNDEVAGVIDIKGVRYYIPKSIASANEWLKDKGKPYATLDKKKIKNLDESDIEKGFLIPVDDAVQNQIDNDNSGRDKLFDKGSKFYKAPITPQTPNTGGTFDSKSDDFIGKSLQNLFPLEPAERTENIKRMFNKYREDNSNMSIEQQLEGFKNYYDGI